jgi:hypoxanthine-DNA glycosylase
MIDMTVPTSNRLCHPFGPLFGKNSRVLILGSFPSVKSREQQFFYGHPQNRFWRVMAAVLACEVPQTIEEKKAMLLEHHVALWDSIASCSIEGSSDASIENVVPNDLTPIFSAAEIRQIFCNGKKSWEMYHHYIEPLSGRPAVCLPSTSPANASWSAERLMQAWRQAILPYLYLSGEA